MKDLSKNRKYWIVCGVLFAIAGLPFMLFLPLLAVVFEVLALILILTSGRIAAFYQKDRPAAVVRPVSFADPEPADAPAFKCEHARVAGVSYREKEILALASSSWYFDGLEKSDFDYGEKIYKFSFPDGPVDLVPEPSNPHDKNAIKVIVSGQHVGYIKSGSCVHYLNLIRDGRILAMKADIEGGPYKLLFDDTIERGDDLFSICLSVKVAQ